MIDDYRTFLNESCSQYRRDLIHAMLVYDPLNADPANGKTPYLRSKQKRKELIQQAIEEVSPYEVEEWLSEAYLREFGYSYTSDDEREEYDEEDEEEL